MGCGTFGGTPLHVNTNPCCGVLRSQPLKNVCCPGGLTLIATCGTESPCCSTTAAKNCRDAECCTLMTGSNCCEKECCTDPPPRRQSWWSRVRRRGFNTSRGRCCNGNMCFPPPCFPYPPPCGQTPCPCPAPAPAPSACQEQSPCAPPIMPYPMPIPMPMGMGPMGMVPMGMPPMGMTPQGSCPIGQGMDFSMMLPMLAMKRMAWYRNQDNPNVGRSGKEGNNNDHDDDYKDADSRGSKSESKLDKIRDAMEDRMRCVLEEKKDTVCSRWKNMCNAKRDICSDPQERCKYGITEEDCKKWQEQCEDIRDMCGSTDDKEKGGQGKGKKSKSSSKGSLAGSKKNKKKK
ncbi:unnamed protein product [Allacma fusca]|uniref:Uncharacterized protein n=1 Tax=Allacma fusca TaxID=39272 RepID=A0A8J2LSC7_9HEXA|nr:unnamed protein product [Allacma fusca]